MCSCFLFSTLLHSLCSLLFTLCEFCPLLNISHAIFVEVLFIFVQLYRLLFFIYSLLYVIVYLYSPYCLLILGMCVYLISNNDFTYFHSIRSLVCLFLFNILTLYPLGFSPCSCLVPYIRLIQLVFFKPPPLFPKFPSSTFLEHLVFLMTIYALHGHFCLSEVPFSWIFFNLMSILPAAF